MPARNEKPKRPSVDTRNFFAAVYDVVRQIPAGRVASYGQIGALLQKPGGARTVGWAMRALPRGTDVPWHRVINSQGGLSLTDRSAALQKALLKSEGVIFDKTGRVDLQRFGWKPQTDEPTSP